MPAFTHDSGQYFTIDGANLYYEEVGNAHKPVLLFLHGGLQYLDDFNPLIPSLVRDFRILGMDSRGQGKSTLGNAPLTYEHLQLDVEALLQFLNITRATVIGHSDGGITAYRLAAKKVIEIEKLITIGSTWQVNDVLIKEALFSKITLAGWKEKFLEAYERYQHLNPEPDFDRLINAILPMWLDKTATGHPNEQVSTITCPTVIVRGDQDHLFTRESVVAVAGKIKNSALLSIPFAGHVAFEEQPEIFQRVVTQFLRQRAERQRA